MATLRNGHSAPLQREWHSLALPIISAAEAAPPMPLLSIFNHGEERDRETELGMRWREREEVSERERERQNK